MLPARHEELSDRGADNEAEAATMFPVGLGVSTHHRCPNPEAEGMQPDTQRSTASMLDHRGKPHRRDRHGCAP